MIKEVGITDLSALGDVGHLSVRLAWYDRQWLAVGQGAGSSLAHRGSFAGVFAGLALAAAGTMGAIPVFWKLRSFYMSGTAIVAGLAVINAIANLAGTGHSYLRGFAS